MKPEAYIYPIVAGLIMRLIIPPEKLFHPISISVMSVCLVVYAVLLFGRDES